MPLKCLSIWSYRPTAVIRGAACRPDREEACCNGCCDEPGTTRLNPRAPTAHRVPAGWRMAPGLESARETRSRGAAQMLRQGEESLWGLHSDVKRMRHPGDLRIRECPMCRPSGAGARASLGGANLAAMARRAYACAAVGGASVPCVCAHHSTGAMGAGAVAGAGAGPGLAPELLRRGGSAWFAAVRSGNQLPCNFGMGLHF